MHLTGFVKLHINYIGAFVKLLKVSYIFIGTNEEQCNVNLQTSSSHFIEVRADDASYPGLVAESIGFSSDLSSMRTRKCHLSFHFMNLDWLMRPFR